MDFGSDPVAIFRDSPDAVKDVAEDVTREVLDRLSGYNIQQRVFGNVDYKRARYIIFPDQIVRQALFVDSKAEKSATTARLQMSEISMLVRQYSQGQAIEVPGKIPATGRFGGDEYLSTTMLLHYNYSEGFSDQQYLLKRVALCAIPNRRLQDRYNPSPQDGIWLAGPHAPRRREEFRVRLSFKLLREKSRWRFQEIDYSDPDHMKTNWQE